MSVFESSESYRPFKFPALVTMAKKHSIDMHWHENQVDLQDDLRQYLAKDGLKTDNNTHNQNKKIVDAILCLFTELDKTVGESYTKLLPHVGNNEVRNWFLTAASREVIHQRSYALTAETFGFSDKDWVMFRKYAEMTDKISLMTNESCSDLSDPYCFSLHLTNLILSEGIGLFAAFVVLLNFKRFGLLVGTNDINQWSLLDENEHVAGNILVLQAVKESLTSEEKGQLKEYTISLAKEYKEAEMNFVDLLFEEVCAEGLSKSDMDGYLNYLLSFRLNQLGIPTEVVKNPLKWLDVLLAAKNHDNFFEKRVTDYSHSGLSGTVDYSVYS